MSFLFGTMARVACPVARAVAWILIWGAAGVSDAGDLAIHNLRAAQVPGRAEVEVLYDLEGKPGTRDRVEVNVSEDGGTTFVEMTDGMSGEVGVGVAPGSKRRIVWSFGERWLGSVRMNLTVRLVAEEGPVPVPEMIRIRAGVFTMGSPEYEPGRLADKGPLTEVRLSRGYWLGKYEVTQEEWEAVMENNPSRFIRQANFDGNYPYGGAAIGPNLRKPVRVGSYAPNSWGLYDMHGNVWEWCLDWYADQLPGGSMVDPGGPKWGTSRVDRGGSWNDGGRRCRSAYRGRYRPGDRSDHLGFRLALVQVL